MSISCSKTLISDPSENTLTSFQLECSQMFQNVCSEATSTFSIFSLMGAGWIGQFAKLSCLNFVSRFSQNQWAQRGISFAYSAALEGTFFHGCSTLKQGMVPPLDFARGSAHSGIILAGCKLTGGIAPQSFILTQLFQCFAIVQINEVCGGILVDQEVGSFGEKMIRAGGTSLPLLFSGQILASCSPGHRIRQAKYDVQIEIQKRGSTQAERSTPFSSFGEDLVTSEGPAVNDLDFIKNEEVKRSNIFKAEAPKDGNRSDVKKLSEIATINENPTSQYRWDDPQKTDVTGTQRAISLIERVHTVPSFIHTLPYSFEIKLYAPEETVRKGGIFAYAVWCADSKTIYVTDLIRRQRMARVRKIPPLPIEALMIHEIGHVMDTMIGYILDSPTTYSASMKKMIHAEYQGIFGSWAPDYLETCLPILRRLKQLVKETQRVVLSKEKLDNDNMIVSQDFSEIFADLYFQYIAEKTKDPLLLDVIAENVHTYREIGQATDFWSPDEFEPLSLEMDSIFDQLGWRVT